VIEVEIEEVRSPSFERVVYTTTSYARSNYKSIDHYTTSSPLVAASLSAGSGCAGTAAPATL